MSKRKDTGSHPVEELEIKDTVAYNAAVQHNPARPDLQENIEYSKGEHQKGPGGKKGGDALARRRK